MTGLRKIRSALISVYHKDHLDEIVLKLNSLGVKIYSTGGTFDYIKKLGVEVTAVETLTGYPSILGGRVKTLHPKIFGGILARRSNQNDLEQLKQYEIPEIDLVIVDLYPFEQTVASGASEEEIIEKIDIGGISLIRAAAKNFTDVLIVASRAQYKDLLDLLETKDGQSSLNDRKMFAAEAFNVSSHYDTAIFNYFNRDFNAPVFKYSIQESKALRYGENPHQTGIFFGNFEEIFDQLSGKEISYNNLLDIDSAVNLINDFNETTCAILKHNNACGLASRSTLVEAWKDALAADPVSAFGGIIVTNAVIDKDTAEEMNKIFFEVVIAPGYEDDALEILMSKKNRIILRQKKFDFPHTQFRSILNGVLFQDRDTKIEDEGDMRQVTKRAPTPEEVADLLFANKIVKHTKSNAIVLAKNKQMLASGVGQTSRVDALKQAIAKAGSFGFGLKGAVMASDAFFPFPDSVEIAHQAGITAIIQPGGSIRDNDSINFCNEHNMAMVFTGIRHFKH
ncbi:MAG TPA: bifunctional phosphoribosylaminoimidazolecarboxamide formyltransferase/IMP cyclohydrolase [Bacteroidales bacterium]|nr:bifunctional phosphoribosylaminoimidazolecarboxamide formyltransferase/IMP cyclohydrolase [Bacteroidales bacterium]HOK97933.1 bifunctional phosphoribosylaminoimidazolecarboxamide formyltransferase/IMP cyclohydrolase [Bacteroidales bacterium]HPO64509.1 bifunctional phosphoribosylaminoimidazolecarboxamide formyltransferase/IMP cyclohydrolase [Bacteroidales bacterium]